MEANMSTEFTFNIDEGESKFKSTVSGVIVTQYSLKNCVVTLSPRGTMEAQLDSYSQSLERLNSWVQFVNSYICNSKASTSTYSVVMVRGEEGISSRITIGRCLITSASYYYKNGLVVFRPREEIIVSWSDFIKWSDYLNWLYKEIQIGSPSINVPDVLAPASKVSVSKKVNPLVA